MRERSSHLPLRHHILRKFSVGDVVGGCVYTPAPKQTKQAYSKQLCYRGWMHGLGGKRIDRHGSRCLVAARCKTRQDRARLSTTTAFLFLNVHHVVKVFL